MSTESRVAIVTGASSGMGKAVTKDLASKGWKVAMLDIKINLELCRDLGDNVVFFGCNVADYNSQAAAFKGAFDKFGRIDALCANAGIVDRSSIYILNHRNSDQIPPAPDLSCTDIDYKGVVYGTQLAIHFMRKNTTPGGKIVATSSMVHLYPMEAYPEYNGAKAAVVNFVRGAAPVLKVKDNITINTILPGLVRTEIVPSPVIEAIQPEHLTQVSNIVSAYDRFLNDDTGMTGEAMECTANAQILLPHSEPLNGYTSVRSCGLYDPLFRMNHGERSELPYAITEPDVVL